MSFDCCDVITVAGTYYVYVVWSKMADNLCPNEVLIKNPVSTAGLCVVELALVRILTICMFRLSYSSNEALV